MSQRKIGALIAPLGYSNPEKFLSRLKGKAKSNLYSEDYFIESDLLDIIRQNIESIFNKQLESIRNLFSVFERYEDIKKSYKAFKNNWLKKKENKIEKFDRKIFFLDLYQILSHHASWIRDPMSFQQTIFQYIQEDPALLKKDKYGQNAELYEVFHATEDSLKAQIRNAKNLYLNLLHQKVEEDLEYEDKSLNFITDISEFIFGERRYLTDNIIKNRYSRLNFDSLFAIEYFVATKEYTDIQELEWISMTEKGFEETQAEIKRYLQIFYEKEGYINDLNSREINLIFNLLYTYSDVLTEIKGRLTSMELRNIINGGSALFINMKQGSAFSKTTVESMINSLNNFIKEHGLYSSKVRKSVLNTRVCLINYIHDYRLYKNDVEYHKNWNKDFPEHCYHLILESMGINIWTEELLPDTVWNWLRHHIYFNKESNLVEDLALVLREDNLKISHPSRLGSSLSIEVDQQKLIEAKEYLREGKKPPKWSSNLWDKYQHRKNAYNRLIKQYGQAKGESIWFKKYYPLFYRMYRSQGFWNTHKL